MICSTHSDSSVSMAGAQAVNVIRRALSTPSEIHRFIIRHILSAFYCTTKFSFDNGIFVGQTKKSFGYFSVT